MHFLSKALPLASVIGGETSSLQAGFIYMLLPHHFPFLSREIQGWHVDIKMLALECLFANLTSIVPESK